MCVACVCVCVCVCVQSSAFSILPPNLPPLCSMQGEPCIAPSCPPLPESSSAPPAIPTASSTERLLNLLIRRRGLQAAASEASASEGKAEGAAAAGEAAATSTGADFHGRGYTTVPEPPAGGPQGAAGGLPLTVVDLGAGNSTLLNALCREHRGLAAFALDYSPAAFDCLTMGSSHAPSSSQAL